MARRSDIVILIKKVPPNEDTTNDNGFVEGTPEQSRSVFGNKKSVGYSEFYKSQQAGMKAELKIDIYTQEYDGEEFAEFEGKRYKILHTYESKNGEFTELTLSDLAERSIPNGEI